MRPNHELQEIFTPLWADLDGSGMWPNNKPLLAHYTNVAAFEGIFKNDEFWMSNPLLMNDHEEMRFGMLEGNEALIQSEDMRKACGNKSRYKLFLDHYLTQYNEHANDLTLDTYVGCFSLHDPIEDVDGRLSMWRGYGSEGNGVAIVFDTARLNHVAESPLILAPVAYRTREERIAWIQGFVNHFARIFQDSHLLDEEIPNAVKLFFQRLKTFALFTKHKGFEDEREWRMVYMRERDDQKLYIDSLSYFISPSGIEPKLKLKQLTELGLSSFAHLVQIIIAGPATSTPFGVASLRRMLESVGKHELAPLVRGSGTPFRSRR